MSADDLESAHVDRTAAETLARLADRGQTLAVAESLTGGLLAAALTGVPGASAVFRGGVTAYASDVKVSALGVPPELVRSVGVVSAEVARAMADGARTRMGASWALSTTGVAGPDSSEGRPAGTVFVAATGPDGVAEVRELALTGDRAQIRISSYQAALELLRRTLDATPTPE